MRLLLVSVALATALAACGEADGEKVDGEGGTGGVHTGAGGDDGTGGGGTGPGDGGTVGEGGAGGSSIEDLWPIDVTWANCPWGPGRCTEVQMPLDWSNPDPSGKTVPFHVRRIPSPTQPAKGQLWLLQGGPGSAGWSMVYTREVFRYIAPGYDLLIPDYRGTGYSAFWGCAGQNPDEINATCMREIEGRWGRDQLPLFSTDSAVHDIYALSQALRTEGQQVMVYGVSYGTFVGNRLITLHPDAADGVILDSVCPATGCDVRMDVNAEKVMRYAFGMCGDDVFCEGKLGDDPWARTLDLFAALEAGHCNEFLGYPWNEMILQNLLIYGATDAELLPVALASIYRAERCEPGDVEALDHLVDYMYGGSGWNVQPSESTSYLSYQIVFSEFWPEGYGMAQVEADLAGLAFEIGTLRHWAGMRQDWPWPLPPMKEKRWSGAEVPLLVMNGDLDWQTHLDGLADVEASFRNEAQHFLSLPLSGHGVIMGSPVVSADRQVTCGMEIAASFFADPHAAPDTRCMDRIGAPNFTGNRFYAQHLLGTDDMWENPVSGSAARSTLREPMPEVDQRKVDELRRKLNEMPTF